MLKTTLYIILIICLLLFTAWASVLIYFLCLPNELVALLAAGGFFLSIPALYFLLPQRSISISIIALLYISVLFLWSTMQASNDRNWVSSVAKLPHTVIESENITVHNIRNFDYKTEFNFIENYYDKSYRLEDLETLSFILSYWGGGTTVAHTILSFGFKNGDYLAVSAETRLEKDEPQGLLQGFFNQYEIIYILADERDVLRLRSNYRKVEPEEVFVYPTKFNKQKVRQVFDIIMARVNTLYQNPEFYNTLTHNCFTSLHGDLSSINENKAVFDWRIFANGYSDQMLYENGNMNTDLSFAEAKAYFHINQYVSNDNSAKDYSLRIRPNLKSQVE
ncbi:MAG: DUF4105 domain-containing protein [Methyloprofundus sp.]|nr:DUF4105 domain-containing protein [Methyloprofundus sp.]